MKIIFILLISLCCVWAEKNLDLNAGQRYGEREGGYGEREEEGEAVGGWALTCGNQKCTQRNINDGRCDSECNNKDCAYDGSDCGITFGREYSEQHCNNNAGQQNNDDYCFIWGETTAQCIHYCKRGVSMAAFQDYCDFSNSEITACEWVEGWGCKLFKNPHISGGVYHAGHSCWVQKDYPVSHIDWTRSVAVGTSHKLELPEELSVGSETTSSPVATCGAIGSCDACGGVTYIDENISDSFSCEMSSGTMTGKGCAQHCMWISCGSNVNGHQGEPIENKCVPQDVHQEGACPLPDYIFSGFSNCPVGTETKVGLKTYGGDREGECCYTPTRIEETVAGGKRFIKEATCDGSVVDWDTYCCKWAEERYPAGRNQNGRYELLCPGDLYYSALETEVGAKKLELPEELSVGSGTETKVGLKTYGGDREGECCYTPTRIEETVAGGKRFIKEATCDGSVVDWDTYCCKWNEERYPAGRNQNGRYELLCPGDLYYSALETEVGAKNISPVINLEVSSGNIGEEYYLRFLLPIAFIVIGLSLCSCNRKKNETQYKNLIDEEL